MTIVSQGSDRFIPATVQFNSQCRPAASMNIYVFLYLLSCIVFCVFVFFYILYFQK